MTPTNRFVVNQRLKLSWKYLKHGMGVAFMLSSREGSPVTNLPKLSKHDDQNVFMNYLDSVRK